MSVVDSTAQGLLDVIEKHFEAMKVPFSKVYSFASDGASVVSSEDRGVERSTYGTGLGKKWCIIQPIS